MTQTIEVKAKDVRWLMSSLRDSSRKYGPCEVCGEFASEVFIRRLDDHSHVFGHESCLRKRAGIRAKRDAFRRDHYRSLVSS